jgi:hypothetical protein
LRAIVVERVVEDAAVVGSVIFDAICMARR